MASSALAALDSSRVQVSHLESKGVGYRHGSTSLEVFSNIKSWHSSYLFLEGRTYLFNNGRVGGNLGLGNRFSYRKAILGYNAFYDFRNFHGVFSRVGVGIDVQKSGFFFSTNTYFMTGPLCRKYKRKKLLYPDGYRMDEVTRKCSFKYNWDAEVGAFFINNPDFGLYAGVGPYFLSMNHICCRPDIWGIKGRITFDYIPWIRLSAYASHDPLFRTRIQGELALIIPFTRPKTHPRASAFLSAARQNIIPLKRSRYWDIKCEK